MSDPTFFRRAGPFTVARLARQLGGDVAASAGDVILRGVAALDRAGSDELTFFEDRRYVAELGRTEAGACLLAAPFVDKLAPGTVAIVVKQPARSFAQAAALFFPASIRPEPITGAAGLSASAHVHPQARLEGEVIVEAGAIVGPGAEIGAGSLIDAGAVIGTDVRIGRDCRIGALCVVQHTILGNRVILHPGVKLGQDGYGYVVGAGGHTKIPQIGRVIIQDDVEIGANTTIDRGTLGDTMVGEGTKIDNQVQIAHNVVIGRHCIITAMVGISGSCIIGDFVLIGGNAGLADHVKVGDGAQIAAKAGVMRDIPAGERWVGTPAKPSREFFREVSLVERLARERRRQSGV